MALLIPDVANPFYFDIIRGTQLQLKAAGYAQLLVDTEESGSVEEQSLLEFRDFVDGVVLCATRLTDEQLRDAAGSTPLVLINRIIEGYPSVNLDTAAGVRQVVDHLVSLGHTHFAYISGPDESWSNRNRWNVVQSAGRRLRIKTVKLGPFAPKLISGSAAADAALNSGATACIAFNDLLAIGVLQRLAERGVDVPATMSVAGCDDIFGADFCNPPLTTVTGSHEQAGRVAIRMLLSQLSDRQPELGNVTLPTHLIIRSSTGVTES